MSINSRWRVDPFDGTVNSILIEDEEHTIEYITELNKYGFYANEGVVLDAGAPVSLVQDNTAQTAFTEQPRTIAPNAGQFRVDYDDEDYYNTGFVQCNAADNGKAVLFTYRGTGTIVHPNFRLNTNFNLPGNAIAEGTLEVIGDVSLASATGSTITANNKKIEDVSTPTADSDAMTYGEFKDALPHSRLFVSSGNFIVPKNVTSVVVEIAGGGGGGAAGTDAATAGGGGGQSLHIEEITVTPLEVILITIGTGGSAGVASGGNGGNGGNSVFGTYITCAGGAGALGNNGGAGGGNAGIYGANNTGESGLNGGGGGGGAPGGTYTSSPYTGRAGLWGGGGGGGATSGGTGYNGGAGGDGFCRVTW